MIIYVKTYLALVVTSVMYFEVKGCTTDENPYAMPQMSTPTGNEEFLIGPDGVTKCVVEDHPGIVSRAGYFHRDQNGKCWCQFCREGQHIQSFCECEKGNNEPTKDTDCVVVRTGQFMNQSNICLVPYNCTASCPETQTLVRNCLAYADIQCQCKEGRYNPNKKDTGNIPRQCLEKPSCPNPGEKPLPNDGRDDEDTRTFSCKMCRDGHFKKEGDGDCKPHRDCQTKAGNQIQDNECLNDPPSVSESPENTASTPTQDPPFEATTEATTKSTSQDMSQTTVPMPVDHENTDPGEKCDTCSYVIARSISIIGGIFSISAFVLCICLYKDRKRLQEELNKLKGQPAWLLHGYVPRDDPGNNAEEDNVM